MKYLNYKIALLLTCLTQFSFAETGYRLWLRYDKIENQALLEKYSSQIKSINFEGNSATNLVAKKEILMAINGLLGKQVPFVSTNSASLIIGTPQSSSIIKAIINSDDLPKTADGFLIKSLAFNGEQKIMISATNDKGVLYGVFHFIRLMQANIPLVSLNISETPAIKNRILNHWDNLDGTVERGYAGSSLWEWHKLPGFTPTRYTDYARANASVGINGTVLNNVNTNALSLTVPYLLKTAALAKVFRPYGIKVYLSARFSAPIEIGGLKTADPLDPQVKQWWIDKTKEIYQYIPDFGGFLVKANSEGQPGPQNYGRNHADGANMLADALAPYGGIVMWRAFVYDDKVPDDRAKQAYSEFKTLDGKFKPNVLVQIKNGAIDFQPREPFHPLFGAMPATPVMMEFQLTQEYLGFSTHLAYLGTMFKEVLAADTYAKGEGSTVAKVISGKLDNHQLTAIAGVANIGSDLNWCGHPFAQANWYTFGRLAWNPEFSAGQLAEEWISLTFTNDKTAISGIKKMMMGSREAIVNYMTPLGLHHIMAQNHHYGPGPWVNDAGRDDWTSVYYHKADNVGIGFNRTATGSNAVAQYFPAVADQFGDVKQVPQKYLLWFHRIKWTDKLSSGSTLWDELVKHYYEGVKSVDSMQLTWVTMKGKIDEDRHQEVTQLLKIQHEEAKWWRDACLLYFQSFSKLPLPAGYEKPEHDLTYYQNLKFSFVPGIKN
ncbi:alpha-glucuronidase family glycosyl hydrolase [Pedobacter cryotolerans]|uniref:Xylan alpha-1,2-glucuronidase n=1 Tax=Pedobacter cryotolerans TaxID=2571270 RepID=A0A4U1BVQ0_9SPHI|nr:alpha-glucuronidase family glycosyl hydrolase [Pedobacter cryotolerans]TKB96636.1 alpha-glucuronidase [Pedobacter cryotolerans]